jgi:hypothetical protein
VPESLQKSGLAISRSRSASFTSLAGRSKTLQKLGCQVLSTG